MILKFLTTNQQYEFTSGAYNIDEKRVKFDSADIPAVDGGFIVINNDGIEVDYSKYAVVYEKTDEYIIFTSDLDIYSIFLIYDPDTNYVTSQIITKESNIENGILQKKGQGKEYAEAPSINLLDEDGFYLFKVNNGEVVSTTKEDKTPWAEQKRIAELESIRDSKLVEIQNACALAITTGIDYNGSHYSYNAEDQSNISNAVTLAQTTGFEVPYHADGESCRLYSLNEIIGIYIAEETNLTHNTTYHNQLKLYLNTLETKAEIEAITYGETILTGEYLETYNMVMAQSQAIINKFIGAEPDAGIGSK